MRKIHLLGRSAIAALLMLGCSGAVRAQTPTWLQQGWTPADRNMFYTTSQGSQMMPYDWFMALERPDSETLFRVDGLARFGYLPNPDRTNNPDRLPVGFVKDVDKNDGRQWFGMTCAACHTNQIRFAGRTLQIDGGPTDADMYALIAEIGKSLEQTSASKTDPKFLRFATKVLGRNPTPDKVDKLFAEVKDFSTKFSQYVKDSTLPDAWGRARLDAFGMIYNRVSSIDLDIPGNSHLPNAPVSYPFLWDTHYHDVVQWNGSAPNLTPFERLARNVGEVLGVFAHTDFDKSDPSPLFFKTSARRGNQLLLELKLASLRSPSWPKQWAPIDATKAAAGAKLYQAHCLHCHDITPRDKPLGPMNVTMTPQTKVGTDKTMAFNALNLQGKAGFLTGVRMPPIIGNPLPADGPSVDIVFAVVMGAVLEPVDPRVLQMELRNNARALVEAAKVVGLDNLEELMQAVESKDVNNPNIRLLQAAQKLLDKQTKNLNELAYKARPLDGIWATAPYLHNGSVPSLYQLLLPVKDRAKQFFVGTRDFDPKNVGFKTDNAPGAFLFDTTKPGNSNAGHDTYGMDAMTDDQRWQLVEYLNTL
jgi:mono/diheme cytochrome c family protein